MRPKVNLGHKSESWHVLFICGLVWVTVAAGAYAAGAGGAAGGYR